MSVLTCRFYSIYIEIIVSVKYSWYSRFFYSNSSQSEHRFNCLTNGRDEIRNSPHFTQKHWYLKTQTWCNTCRKLHQISQSPTQWSPLTTPWQIELRGSARIDNSMCGIAEFCFRSLIHAYLSELTHASSCKVHVSLRCNKRMTIHEQLTFKWFAQRSSSYGGLYKTVVWIPYTIHVIHWVISAFKPLFQRLLH